MIDDIDHLAKNTSGFPSPTDRWILVPDPWGLDSIIFPIDETYAKVFRELPIAVFPKLFKTSKQYACRRFELPPSARIHHRRYGQDVYVGDDLVFETQFDRGYEGLSFFCNLRGPLKGLNSSSKLFQWNGDPDKPLYRLSERHPWVAYSDRPSQITNSNLITDARVRFVSGFQQVFHL